MTTEMKYKIAERVAVIFATKMMKGENVEEQYDKAVNYMIKIKEA